MRNLVITELMYYESTYTEEELQKRSNADLLEELLDIAHAEGYHCSDRDNRKKELGLDYE